MKPATENPSVAEVLDRIMGVFLALMGFGAKKRLLKRLHPKVQQGVRLDPSETFEEMKSHFWHTLRIGISLFLVFPVSIFLVDAYGYQFNEVGTILYLLFTVIGSWLFCRAFQFRFRKAEFEKCPSNDETHAFLHMLSGAKILRKWSVEFPELHKFMVANKIYEEFSTFEFDLVQSYAFAQRRSAT